MLAGLFDHPRVKAERQMAKGAGTLRQHAATNFEIDARMLLAAIARAEIAWERAQGDAYRERRFAVSAAMASAQKFLAHIDKSLPHMFAELDAVMLGAVRDKQFGPVVEIEGELKKVFEGWMFQARDHQQELGVATMELIDQFERDGEVSKIEADSESVGDRLAGLERRIAGMERT